MKHTIPPRGTEVTEADELARLVPAPHDACDRYNKRD